MEHIMLCEAYLELGRIPDAVRQWEQGILHDSKFDNAVAHGDFGERLLRAGSVRDALPHLQRAYELDPQNATYRTDYQTTKQVVAEKQNHQ